jgi:hypothetical protein
MRPSVTVRQLLGEDFGVRDKIAYDEHYGEFCGSASGSDFNIPRPSHPAFHPHGVLMPEQSYAERDAYSRSITDGASLLITKLQGDETL